MADSIETLPSMISKTVRTVAAASYEEVEGILDWDMTKEEEKVCKYLQGILSSHTL